MSVERQLPEESADDLRRRERVRRHVSRQLGIEIPPWEGERLAPEVDEAAILKMLAGEGEREQQLRICKLIGRFRSWAIAYCRLGTGFRRADEREGEKA